MCAGFAHASVGASRIEQVVTDTLCHLIYTVVTDWHDMNDSTLTLVAVDGEEVSKDRVRIPTNGSLDWRAREMFGDAAIARAGRGGLVVERYHLPPVRVAERTARSSRRWSCSSLAAPFPARPSAPGGDQLDAGLEGDPAP